ncbi:efflux RND transporter periplasmic adaptor subunit [Clostridium cellulovorans]|uniref:Uncharacterized protein n=1 Tax=Clostridium cellulovorans (strain ATCC 35296 / DSM 3052 / OCM 3 / 743B) TaxID=573061 RepID=D9SVT2_CLOC7|nr:efflux RND transporter periplasmic adaptor subunit [Clostridium cellulovorans]ADL53143.1 hypothetical protein Clocel_3465 [Clostridium cellulovorans 743B]
MKKTHIIGIIVIVVAVGAAVAIGIGTKKSKTTDVKATKVELFTVPQSKKVYVNGIIEPESYKDIYLDASKGTVNTTNVTNGQVVKAGDILFTYKNEQVTETLNTCEDTIATARRQRDSNTAAKNRLEAKKQEMKNVTGALSGVEDFDSQISTLNDQISAADAQISSYQDKINKLREKETSNVVSPIDGIVTLREIETNMTKPYITVESNILCVNGTVNEKDKLKLTEGKAVDIYIFGQKKNVTGKIATIGAKPIKEAAALGNVTNSAGSSVSNYEIKIAFDSQENLINGFHVQATILLNDGGIKIPATSLINEEDKYYVFKDVDGKFEKAEVVYGGNQEDDAIILQGLSEGDKIAEEPTADTKEGTKVE